MIKNPNPKRLPIYDFPKVMFVVTTPFAINAFLTNHILALSKNYKITICTNRNAYEVLPHLVNATELCHIPFSRQISPLQDLKNLLKLIILLRQIRPIVVHSITPKAGLLAMFAGFAANIHHRWHTFTGQVWINKKGFSRIVLKTADLIIARLASRVFTDSASQSRFLLDEGVTRSGQITILGPGSIAGVDINRFRPDTANRVRIRDQMCVDTDACVFLFVGRINKDKGIFDLIQAFQRLATRLRGIELWVVGPDEEGLTQTLQQLAQECSAPIRWLGATSAPEEFMMAADILLLPSYREGFGSVVIEGAACGIPTVAYRINGVIDAVADGSTGILVEPGETSAFESAMRQLALDKELRLSLGNKARERAVRDFNSEQVTKAWLDFYRCHLHQSNEAA